MGLGDLFKRRAKRESAIPSSETELQPLGSFASPEGQPVVGQQVAGGAQQFSADLSDIPGMMQGFAALAQIGPMIQQAMAEGSMTQNPDGSYSIGSVNVEQGEATTIDLSGTDLRDQILGIMREHGIDASGQTQGQSIDPSTIPGMQQQILDALSKHGIDPAAGQINPPSDT